MDTGNDSDGWSSPPIPPLRAVPDSEARTPSPPPRQRVSPRILESEALTSSPPSPSSPVLVSNAPARSPPSPLVLDEPFPFQTRVSAPHRQNRKKRKRAKAASTDRQEAQQRGSFKDIKEQETRRRHKIERERRESKKWKPPPPPQPQTQRDEKLEKRKAQKQKVKAAKQQEEALRWKKYKKLAELRQQRQPKLDPLDIKGFLHSGRPFDPTQDDRDAVEEWIGEGHTFTDKEGRVHKVPWDEETVVPFMRKIVHNRSEAMHSWFEPPSRKVKKPPADRSNHVPYWWQWPVDDPEYWKISDIGSPVTADDSDPLQKRPRSRSPAKMILNKSQADRTIVKGIDASEDDEEESRTQIHGLLQLLVSPNR